MSLTGSHFMLPLLITIFSVFSPSFIFNMLSVRALMSKYISVGQ